MVIRVIIFGSLALGTGNGYLGTEYIIICFSIVLVQVFVCFFFWGVFVMYGELCQW